MADACSAGLALQPRLSTAAERELVAVLDIISCTTLDDEPDSRHMSWGGERTFSSLAAYAATERVDVLDTYATTCWRSRLPSKIKIFCLLADSDRFSSRSNLHYKGCAPSSACISSGAVETTRHILFGCARAVETWQRLACDVTGCRSIWDIPCPAPGGDEAWVLCLAAILWQLWKARNDSVFNARSDTATEVLRHAADDITLWCHRFSSSLRSSVEALHGLITHCSS